MTILLSIITQWNFLQNLFDEHAQSLISRLLSKLEYISEYLIDNLEKEHVLALLSLLGTIIFMFAVGYVMVYFVRVEEENLKQKGHLNGSNSSCKYQKLIFFFALCVTEEK